VTALLVMLQDPGSPDWNSNLVSALTGGVVGAILAAWLTWLFSRPAEIRSITKENRLAASAYIRAVSAALLAMAADFRKGLIPHKSGHEFIGALQVFKEYVYPHLGAEAVSRLAKLEELASEAEKLDSMIYHGMVPSDLEKWADEAEGVAGDLGAAAVRLEGKPHK
jgi:hypothetical protein